jgi:hypothetical protein
MTKSLVDDVREAHLLIADRIWLTAQISLGQTGAQSDPYRDYWQSSQTVTRKSASNQQGKCNGKVSPKGIH